MTSHVERFTGSRVQCVACVTDHDSADLVLLGVGETSLHEIHRVLKKKKEKRGQMEEQSHKE